MAVRRAPPKKENVETLQENHLIGPASEPIDQIEQELKVDQVVVVDHVPKYESVVFRNNRDPGYPLEFHFASKTCPFQKYTLIDGKKYDLPVEVIKNLEGCRENIYKHRRNADGNPETYVAGYRTHFACERA